MLAEKGNSEINRSKPILVQNTQVKQLATQYRNTVKIGFFLYY